MLKRFYLCSLIFFIYFSFSACTTTNNQSIKQAEIIDQAKQILDQRITNCLTNRLALSQKSELSVTYLYKNNRLRINSADAKLNQYIKQCVALTIGPSITVQGKVSISRKTGNTL